jgi:glycosyltransferase involved in cell wall biosynthesis
MIKVLHVIPATPGEGSGMIFAKRQVASVQDAGVEVNTFFLTSRVSPSSLWREWRELRREIKQFKPDLIHAHYGTMTAFLCAFGTTAPLVVTYRGSDLNPTRSVSHLRSIWGRVLSQLAALRASRIICVSRSLKERLLWRRSLVTVIPTGVNLELFAPSDRNEARSFLGWSPSEQVVLFNVGRSPRVKRLDRAQAAFDIASGRRANLRLVVLNGGTDPKLVPVYLSAADCLLFTSDNEGSPNIVKEALACNLPIVSVEVGDVVERLAGVHPARIVERDPQILGEALLEVLALERRSNGRELVASIAEDKLAQDIKGVYESVLEQRHFRSPLRIQRAG